MEIVKEFDAGQSITKLYCKDDAVIYISKGKIFKSGFLNFEKIVKGAETNEKPEKIILYDVHGREANEQVKDMALGNKHILILTESGKVFTWGDNYYGQLGIGNWLIPVNPYPRQINIDAKIESITAFRNNSYAIDDENKLWVWGKSEFLGVNFKSNLNKPTKILSQYNIFSLKINQDRIIVYATKDVNGEKSEEQDKESKSEHSDEENSEINDPLSFLNELQLKCNKMLSDDNMLSKSLANIRATTLNQSLIRGDNMNQLWTEIKQLIEDPVQTANKDLLTKSIIDSFHNCLNAVLIGSTKVFEENPAFRSNFVLSSANQDKLFAINPLEDGTKLIKLKQDLTEIFSYQFKYRKLEVLIHKLSCHKMILESSKFKNVIDGINMINGNDSLDVEKKLYLIEKTFQSLNILVDKNQSLFGNINQTFKVLSKISITDSTNDSDTFMYKNVIETNYMLNNLWKALMESVKSQRIEFEKVEEVKKCMKTFEELYANANHLLTFRIYESNAVEDEDQALLLEKLENDLKDIEGVRKRIKVVMKNNLKEVEIMDNSFKKMLDAFYSVIKELTLYMQAYSYEVVKREKKTPG